MTLLRVITLLCCLVEAILCSSVPINVHQIKASGKSGTKYKLTGKCLFTDLDPVIAAGNAKFTIELDRATTNFKSKQVTVQSTNDTSYTVTNRGDINKSKYLIAFSVVFNTPPTCFPTGTCTLVPKRKNVLFLVADDLRVQLGAYEDTTPKKMHTPNLDQLAAKSMVLKKAYVQQAVCSPSRASLLTGRRPDTTKVFDLDTYWRNAGGNFTTIPQYFKENGYKSIGMGKIYHPGASSGYDDPLSWSADYDYFRPGRNDIETSGISWIAVPDAELVDNPLRDELVADHAVDTLRSLTQDAESGDSQDPWFMAVGFYKPHLPFIFPESVLDYYPEDTINLPDNPYAPINMPQIAWSYYGELRNGYTDIQDLNVNGYINTTLPDTKTLELRRAYYAAVTWMDSQLGRVLDELDRLNMSDNTIISFWGDHGWQLGEHGAWCKHTNFDIATHAPMMIHIPGMTDDGQTTEKLTEFVDLFPTLVEAAGLSQLQVCPEDSSNVPNCREGSSLMPLIRDSNAPWKNAVFSQFPRSSRTVMGYSMTTSQYRYTEWIGGTYTPTEVVPDWDDSYGVELYCHVTDPGENNNKADQAEYAEIRQALSTALRAGWRNVLP